MYKLYIYGKIETFESITDKEKRLALVENNRLLLGSFINRLEQLSEKNIFIRRIVANAITSEGVSLCSPLGCP
jgi:hypothetical protein